MAENYRQQREGLTAMSLGAIAARLPTGLRQASPATCRASVARNGQSREKRRARGEPAGYELGEEPHALRLACLPLCEKPNRSVFVQVGARDPHQQGVGISNEARQCRHPEPLPYSNDLRLGIRDPEWNPRGANLALGWPNPEFHECL
jgi:hypothetical protein